MYNELFAENPKAIGHSYGEYSGLSGWLQSAFLKKINFVFNYQSHYSGFSASKG